MMCLIQLEDQGQRWGKKTLFEMATKLKVWICHVCKVSGYQKSARWPERPESLASLCAFKQNCLHGFANYHSEDAAICYFQSASQQRGMKRAESQREQRLSFIQGKQEPLTGVRLCVCVCLSVHPLQIKQSSCISSSFTTPRMTCYN